MRSLHLLPLVLISLSGCASTLAAPVDRADRALESRLLQVERMTESAIAGVDTRLAERLAQSRKEAEALSASVLSSVDERVTAQREAVREDVRTLMVPVLEQMVAARAESAEWRTVAEKALQESAEWRKTFAEQSARWEQTVRPIAEAVATMQASASVGAPDARSTEPGQTTDERPWWVAGGCALLFLAWKASQRWRTPTSPEKSEK